MVSRYRFPNAKISRVVFYVYAFLKIALVSLFSKNESKQGHPLLLSPHSDPIAYHAAHVFVVNTQSDTLDIIDAKLNKIVSRIATGIDPVSVAIRPDGKEIWVSNHLSDSISVIDNNSKSSTYHSIVATIQDMDLEKKATRFDEPVGIAFASNKKAYVALSSNNEIAVIDVKTRRVAKRIKITAQEPRAIKVKNDKLYVIPFESNNRTQLSGGVGKPHDGDLVTFDARKLASAFDSVGFTVDVIKHPEVPDKDLFIFDTINEKPLRTFKSLGTNLFGLDVTNSGEVFIAQTDAQNHVNGRAGTKKHGLEQLMNRPYLNQLTKVSSEGKARFINLNPLPPEQPNRKKAIASPFAIKASSDGRIIYCTAAGSDHFFAIDSESGETLAKVKVGSVPRGIAFQRLENGKEKFAWIYNAVSNSVTKVDLTEFDQWRSVSTIQLDDPTFKLYKEGRIAFNTSRASSNGTFSCASCHADGNTDQLLWVLETPHLVGADQIEPRLSQTLRGLRGTAPYHWDGVPGDPYGGKNAATREMLEPNSDVNRPETSVRNVIDGSMATTMLDSNSDIRNDENKKGYLTKKERDAMAEFLLNLSHMPTKGRSYDDKLSDQALIGFERFHITGARDQKNLNTNVCGSCHTFPYLATDQDSMQVPSFRGALDRFITQAQGRNSVIDLGGVKEIAERGFPEEEVWKRMFNMGEPKRLWPVIDMFKESSSGFPGAFGRQATLSDKTVNDPVTLSLIKGLEESAKKGSILLKVSGLIVNDSKREKIKLSYLKVSPSKTDFEDGLSISFGYKNFDDSGQIYSLKSLIRKAKSGAFVGTFTGVLGDDFNSPPPAIWTAGSLHEQRGAQLFPRINEEIKTMRISARYVKENSYVFVNGKRYPAKFKMVGKDLADLELYKMPPKGINMVQIQNPKSYISNELIFFVESREEAILRYKKEPPYLLTTILNSCLINDNIKEAKILIEAGSDLNMPHEHFDKERPPIIIASQYGHEEVVKILLENGANPNIQTKSGDTALHSAARMGRFDITKMLIESGADTQLSNQRKKKPINFVNHFSQKGNFEKYHAPHNVNLTLDHARYVKETPKVTKLLNSSAKSKRANVLLLMSDDLGIKDIGSYGGFVKTPNIDRLASGGVKFTEFHAGAVVCSPSRATFLTGRQHLRTGVYTVIQDSVHSMHLLEREVTIAELLKEKSYQTVHLGKWHLGTPFRGIDKPSLNDHGFDYWFATENNANPSHKNPVNFVRNGKEAGKIKGYACQIIADEAINWFDKEYQKDRPFFINLWFQEPHAPIAAPDEIVSKYGKVNDPAAIYSGTVENTDKAIGRILKKLDSLGELENTIIVYTSDHGSYRTERNGDLRGDKGSNFQGGLRTPGIIYWPKGIKGGRSLSNPAGSVDLLPTLCGLLHIAPPKNVHLDGSNLTPLLTSKGKFHRKQSLFWHSPTGQPNVALRKGDYTLLGYRELVFKRDQKRINELVNEAKVVIEKDLGRTVIRKELFSMLYNSKFKNKEAEKIRAEFVRLNQFQESWIPEIKKGSGGFRKFELYDLKNDPNQTKDISNQKPELFNELKNELIALNKSVLSDAPYWGVKEIKGPQIPGNVDSVGLGRLLKKIDTNKLPKAYNPSTHQKYVDKRIEGMSLKQRQMLGSLWKEKQRIDPDMKNRGNSFIRILEYSSALD